MFLRLNTFVESTPTSSSANDDAVVSSTLSTSYKKSCSKMSIFILYLQILAILQLKLSTSATVPENLGKPPDHARTTNPELVH
jgi:hypothetical protein